ncbi:MAG: tRNA (adenosine(37)-N6)-threonylcarbamoyltransferase complex transferase subunit TsaD [Bdellovibrionaceae bacterium]|nr:tRNA (adenosine(37)-N6)-threonylcarbamoyltransferase complex transferase subunit TsaD [Pseudobdellovibrionaceae bacterium]
MIKRVLSIETSCDDTSVAVVRHDGFVESVVSANQDLQHAPFGGIVPEIACRNHTLNLLPLVEEALKKSGQDWDGIEGIAVTNRPGLIGSLIVGVSTAKTLAQVRGLPLIGVNHLEGHLQAAFLKDDQFSAPADFTYPFVALAVSGGHSTVYYVPEFGRYEVLGTTMDDAAGEAFDKFAKMLGLGFPGGVQVDKLAQTGNPTAFELPRSLIKEDNEMMSFSGLKSSAARLIESLGPAETQKRLNDLCASFQEAIVDVLIAKLDRAVRVKKCKRAVITGGVSANSRLRARGQEWAQKMGVQLVVPPIRYCTDNAAMIGRVGVERLNRGERDALDMGPSPSSQPADFVGENR